MIALGAHAALAHVSLRLALPIVRRRAPLRRAAACHFPHPHPHPHPHPRPEPQPHVLFRLLAS
ncbi:hypothetical protein SAMN05216551_113108 [Chitinasiproducens palmae]|uniref:Uncharacterized protein n=1 Tax=Chitinasiproducens palmae TaxID=1770053 RepID=A0A1H2PVC5_9BURK|nr:hypothetical protein SAMN05216551_113108 [Chitinasiproducens palmae]